MLALLKKVQSAIIANIEHIVRGPTVAYKYWMRSAFTLLISIFQLPD